MEEYDDGLTSETITDWINKDKGLQKIIHLSLVCKRASGAFIALEQKTSHSHERFP